MPASAGDARGPAAAPLRAKLLGPFAISKGDKKAGPWPRPTAKRLCELVLISPERRVGREVALEVIFPSRSPAVASRAISTALSNARTALAPLGTEAASLLQADRTYIWMNPACPLEVDVDLQRERLGRGMGAEPGVERDDLLTFALADESTLLDDELYADWALIPRQELERLRQEARLALARDRARGYGRCTPESLVQAWEACLAHDPSGEEAASALIRVYGAQKRLPLLEATYKRCRAALEEMGLKAPPALEQLYADSRPAASAVHSGSEGGAGPGPRPQREELRLVTVLFAGADRSGRRRQEARPRGCSRASRQSAGGSGLPRRVPRGHRHLGLRSRLGGPVRSS